MGENRLDFIYVSSIGVEIFFEANPLHVHILCYAQPYNPRLSQFLFFLQGLSFVFKKEKKTKRERKKNDCKDSRKFQVYR